MIIWSGWGLLVPLYVIVAFGVSIVGVTATGAPDPWGPAIGFILTGLLAGAAIFFTARALDSREGRVLLDEKTGSGSCSSPRRAVSSSSRPATGPLSCRWSDSSWAG